MAETLTADTLMAALAGMAAEAVTEPSPKSGGRGNLTGHKINGAQPPSNFDAGDDRETIRAALQVIDPDLGYQEWLSVLMGAHSVDSSGGMLALVDEWSRGGTKYKTGEVAAKWRSFEPGGGTTVATIAHLADQTGRDWRPKRTTPRNHFAGTAPAPLPELDDIAEDDTRDNTVDGDPGQLHPNLIHAGGFLGDFVAYTLRTAPRPQPEFALAGALCVLSALTGRKIRDTSGIRGNIYAVCCGETSGGKDHPRTVAKRLLTIADSHECLLEDVKSGPGVTAALNVHPVRLVLWDEFGRALAGMTSAGKNAPWLATLMTALLKMFTSAGSAYFGEAQADASKITTIHDPHLSVLGSATEVGFFAALNEDVVMNGCLNRSLVFHGVPNVRLVDAGDEDVPQSLVQYAEWWKGYSPGGNLHGHVDGPPATRLLRYSELAQAHLRAFIELCEDRRESIPHEWERALRGRQIELAKRLAMLHAVSLYCATEVIEVQSVAWACEVVEHCVSRLVWHASTRISANPYESQLKELVRVIQEAGPDGMTQSALARRFQRINARVRSELLHHAFEAGHVYSQEDETGGRKRVRYIARNPIVRGTV